jgi:hypothetical protein
MKNVKKRFRKWKFEIGSIIHLAIRQIGNFSVRFYNEKSKNWKKKKKRNKKQINKQKNK